MSLATLVKELRERTGAGMMDCKKALEASDNDMDKAVEWLRENGIAKAAKKGDRVAAEGLTKTLIQGDKALILELNAETDFVAKNKEFLELLDNISEALINSDAQTLEEGLKVSTNGQTVEELVTTGTATIGEKITLRRFDVLTKEPSQSFVSYSHMGGQISSLVVLEKEDEELGKGVAMHIAAEKPLFLKTEDVSKDVLDKEEDMIRKETIVETLKKEEEKVIKDEEQKAGKTLYSKEEVAERLEKAGHGTLPENLQGRIDGIVKGRVGKFLKQSCLLEQGYIMDDKKSVLQVVSDAGNSILMFKFYEVGEGIEKQEVSFAEEVAAQARI